MARHYGTSSTEPPDDSVLLSGASKGKALIICSTSGREKWEIEHGHACHVMEQLGLQVEDLNDKSAEEMLTAISKFSKSSGHGSLVALCIMSHGDLTDNICGNEGEGLCSVKDIVKALCQPSIQSVTKLVFLSYCRGKLGRCNRTSEGWVTKCLKPLAQLVEFNPILKGVDGNHLKSVRQFHPFPSVALPQNCYICYSTLPDSVSQRFNPSENKPNQMFVGLSEHLSTIYQCSKLYRREDITFAVDSARDSTAQYGLVNTSTVEMDVTTPTQQLPRV